MYDDIRRLIDDISKNWKYVAERFQYAKSKYFYREDFISLLLFNRTYKNLPKTTFINYQLAFRYYSQKRVSTLLKFRNKEKKLDVPYAELVNFIKNPHSTIEVHEPITEFELPQDIIARTEPALNRFLTERPNTTNGPALRLADFSKLTANRYVAKLNSSRYYNEIRTNATLDHHLKGDFFQTLRLEDLDKEAELPSFNQSKMANHIGVSTVITFQSSGYWYFHMLPRQANLGIFTNMLSSVSGLAEPPHNTITDLVDYASSEMKRELAEETGLDVAGLENDSKCQVIPLALTREFTRGGNPQFFFLTVLSEMSQKEFDKVFKTAAWKSEFRSDAFSNIKSIGDIVSPEFSTNLLYAMQYIQMRQKLPTDPLILL
jgi:hypothetical protein